MAKATHAHITPVPETHSPNMPINLARRLLLAGLPAAVAIAAVPAIAPQPDAELISLCEELQRLHDARLAGFANDIEPLQYEEPAAWKAWDERESTRTRVYHDALDHLVYLQPTTSAGIAAKARATCLAIRANEEDLDGRLSMDNHFELALALAEDCIRLQGGAA